MRLERKWRTSSSFGLLPLLLTEFLHFLELASDAALACEFPLFHLDFFLVPRTGTSSQKLQFNFKELNVERLVLSLAQMKHASPLSQKFDQFLGCSIPTPPRPPLLKQVFDWATGGVVEISLD